MIIYLAGPCSNEHRSIMYNAHADAVFVISEGRNSTAGTNWEQGYAFTKGIPVFVFQINKNPTSLMIFCGCDRFFQFSSLKHDGEKIAKFADFIEDSPRNQYDPNKKCEGVLT